MKRLILIILILSGIIGCTGSRKSVISDRSRTDTEIQKSGTFAERTDSTVTDKTKSFASSGAETFRQISEDRQENRTGRLWLFDTGKPLTPFGMPPVSLIFDSEYITNSNTQLSELQRTEIISQIQNDIRIDFQKEFEAKFDSLVSIIKKNNIKSNETSKPPAQWKVFIAGSLVTLILILLVRFYGKFNIFQFFRK